MRLCGYACGICGSSERLCVRLEMNIAATTLQEKIDYLQNMVESLFHVDNKDWYVYADDLSQLNQKIHEEIEELYSLQADTEEQEAALCIAMLMGYSVSIYANLEDEIKRRCVLERSYQIMDRIVSISLKKRLHAICDRYNNY